MCDNDTQKDVEEYKAIQENVNRKASYISEEFQNADKELAKAIENLKINRNKISIEYC